MRIIILVCVFISLIVIGLGGWYLIRLYKTGATTKSERAVEAKPVSEGTPYDAIPEYEKRCGGKEEDILECAWLKGLVVAQTVEALEDIEYSHDQRGVSEALEALELVEEPEIQIAACRILALFPDDPAIASKVSELLFSPFTEVQRIAAQLLTRTYDNNPALGGMGYQWSENHGGLQVDTPYDEVEIPSHYAQIGFPEFTDAGRFPPADSDRSIGWITTDPASNVESELSAKLGVKSMSYEEWYEHKQQLFQAAASVFDPAMMAEAEKLMEQYTKTQDPKLLEQIQELQKKMSEPMEKVSANAEKAVDKVTNPPHGVPADTLRYFITEEKEGRVSKVIVMYPQPALRETVIQMTWDLNDYQKAWPDRTE